MSDIEPESKSSACQVAFGQTSKSMEKGTYKFMGHAIIWRSPLRSMGRAILEAIRSLSNQAQFKHAKEAESNAAKSMPSIEEEPAESMPGKVPIEEESILGKRKSKEAFESNTAKSMAAKVPREEELAKSMPGKLPPIEEEPGLGKVPIEGEPAKTMLGEAAKSMEDGKAKSTETSTYSLHNDGFYQFNLNNVVARVKMQRRNAGSLTYQSVTPTADFQSDLDMKAGDINDLENLLHPDHNMDFGCLIHPDDLPDLKCCEDVAKYICFNKQAKEATRKAIRSLQDCRKSPAYKALLAQVTEIYREVFGNKEWRFEATADFKNESGLGIEDVYVFSGEIRRRMPWCSSIIYNLYKLRSFQDDDTCF